MPLDPEQLKMLQQSFQNSIGQPGVVSAGQNLQNYIGNQSQPIQSPIVQPIGNDQQALAKQMALRQLMAQNQGQ